MKTVFFTIAIEPSEKLKRSFVTLSRAVVYRNKRYSLSMYGQRKDYFRFRVAIIGILPDNTIPFTSPLAEQISNILCYVSKDLNFLIL